MAATIVFSLYAVIVVFVIAWFAAKEFYKLAEDKGYHSKKYFWWAFLVPVVGYLLIVAMPDKGGEQRAVYNQDLPDL